MRTMSLIVLSACAGTGQDERRLPAECPYDFSVPFEANTGEPTFDEFLEAVPGVSVEVARIDSEIRDACAAIARDLGRDAAGLDQAAACDLAVELVEATVAANPLVVFECSPEPSYAWWGAATDPTRMDALVATLNAQLPVIRAAAEAAEAQEEVSEDSKEAVASLESDQIRAFTDGEHRCLVMAIDVFDGAIMDCEAFGEDFARLSAAIPCGSGCPYDFSAPFDADTGDSSLDTFLEAAPGVDAQVDQIDREMRAGCAAIADGLGGDIGGKGTLGACELALGLVQGRISEHTSVRFEYTRDPELSISWSGSTPDPSAVDAFVALLEAHLGRVADAADAAPAQQDVADAMLGLPLGEPLEAKKSECVQIATAIFSRAAAACPAYVAASQAFFDALARQ